MQTETAHIAGYALPVVCSLGMWNRFELACTTEPSASSVSRRPTKRPDRAVYKAAIEFGVVEAHEWTGVLKGV
jgi:hypothetical protein